MKKSAFLLLAALLLLCAPFALAAQSEPIAQSVEESFSCEGRGIRVSVDRWHYEYEKMDLRFLVAHVYVDEPGQLQTAFAGEAYSERGAEATSAIAERHSAVLAVNGDYYNYNDKTGLVIRNGTLYRDLKSGGRDVLLAYADGSLSPVYKADYEPDCGQAYLQAGVAQSWTFGPVLVDGGQAVPIPEKYAFSTYDDIREPRTGIGIVEEGHYVLLVADGRRKGWSDKGMNLSEMQQAFLREGCQVAYNLDGGGSATMVLDGEVLNKASGSRERDVSDIIFFTERPE